jgi:UDP-N-acetyl-D-mannosaminuronic acid dehydrogenase
VDVNPDIVDILRRGDIHIHEPGLRETYKTALASGNLTVTGRPEEADAYLITVPTPFHEDRSGEYNGQKYKLADMRAVISATEAILPFLRKGNLVVLESTSFRPSGRTRFSPGLFTRAGPARPDPARIDRERPRDRRRDS